MISQADLQRQRGLRRMKLVAGALLVLAAIVYALTTGHTGWPAWVNAASEAAMVGALADWFAVTALFRHPLGLPVPHTAIIPTRKDALGRSLEEFVTTNFLAEDVVRDKVASADVSRRVGNWVADPGHAEQVGAWMAIGVAAALRRVREEDLNAVLDQVVVQRVLAHEWSRPTGRLLGQVIADGSHHRLVDLGLDHLHTWLRDNPDAIKDLVLERAPLWTPGWLDARMARRIHTELLAFVIDLRADPHHHARQALDALLARLADDLQNDPATMRRAERVAEAVLSHPDVRDSIGRIWSTGRLLLLEAVEDPRSELRRRAADALAQLGVRLVEDAALRATADGHVADAAGFIVRTYGQEVATVIGDTVARWDGAEASRRIELHVGRDLQFIRINGTVVGALAGTAIHAVTVLGT